MIKKMKLIKFYIFILAILVVGAAGAAIPNTESNPKTFLGPTGRLGVTKLITENSAYSVAGELGLKNMRIGGTVGWEFDYNQRIKASAELLRQKLTYSFFNGTQDVWLNQGAAGLNYQYDFREVDPFNTLLDLSGYYSHAPSKSLGVTTGSYIPAGAAAPQPFADYQRIAGSDAFGASPGITIATLDGTRAGAELNYDNVQYDTKNRTGLSSKGFGGTVKLSQLISEDVTIGASAAVRQPFNNYQADVSFDNIDYYGTWVLKLFGAYTIGKNTLPTTYNVGLGADYLIDEGRDIVFPAPRPMPNYKDGTPGRVYKDAPRFKDDPAEVVMHECVDKDFMKWVAVPAVYMPQVLAVPDEKVVQTCVAPSFVGLLGGITQNYEGAFVENLNNFFSGTDLVYTIDIPAPQVNDGSLSISGNNLVGNPPYNAGAGFYTDVTVTATNSCGSATSNAFSAED